MSSFKKCIGVTCILLFLLSPHLSFSQTIPKSSLLDEQVTLQILLSDSLTFSTVNRPFSAPVYHSYVTGNRLNSQWWNRNLLDTKISLNSIAETGVLPFFVQNTVNTKIPYGENNGAAWYGRGANTEFMGGFYLLSEFLSVNFYPHIVYQENRDYKHPRFVSTDRNGNTRYVAEGIGNVLDAPFRFGPDPYTTVSPGNSSIRLHYKKIETGLSSEPLWWGPAVRYPLAMSNNAAGLQHLFLASREPVRIPYFGKIQFRWIMGYPQDTKYFDGPTQGDTRFMNAINLAYNPSFFEQITLGFIRVYHMIEADGFDFDNVSLIFKPGLKQDSVDPSQGGDITEDRNQLISLYVHLQLPEANAEIYAELLREDRSHNIRDFINEPHHNSAFTVGFQKITYLPWVDFIKTNLELTNLTTSQLRQVRPQTYIYSHSKIRQGHTNQGEVMGAAIGPGSNSQFLAVDAYKGNYKFGLFVQRWVDNNNFHFRRGAASVTPSRNFGDYFRHRVNLNAGLNFLYGPGPFYINSRLTWTKAYNYGRFDYGEFDGITIRNYEHNDLINIQFQIGFTYIF